MKGIISIEVKTAKFEAFKMKLLNKYEGLYILIDDDISSFKLDQKHLFKCLSHGEFKTKPYNLVDRSTPIVCPNCSLEKKPIRLAEGYIAKVNLLFDNYYDYTLAMEDYKGCSSKIRVLCPVDGEFTITASQHMKGIGCLRCGRRDNFLQRCSTVHNDRYDYSKVDYTGSFNKVIINCKIHGDFLQSPASHVQGSGCPICNNELQSYDFLQKYIDNPEIGKQNCSLYLLDVVGNGERFLKIGISMNFNKRMTAYGKYKDYTFTTIKYWQSSNLICAAIEDCILRWKKGSSHYWPRIPFDGRSECIHFTRADEVQTIVEDLFCAIDIKSKKVENNA